MEITLRRNRHDPNTIEAWGQLFPKSTNYLLWIAHEDVFTQLVENSLDEITEEGITVEMKIKEEPSCRNK